MKIATTTGDFAFWCKTDEERIKELHRAGFRYIDLNMYEFTPVCDYMTDDWKNIVKNLKTVANNLEMNFVQAHSASGNPLSDDEEHVKFLIAAIKRSVDICAELGIPNTVVHPGFAPKISKEEFFERNRVFFKELLPYAKDKGVNILAENGTKVNYGDMYFLNNGKDAYDFVKFVGEGLHVCWDTGHANCEGSQYEQIMALKDELYAIHYNDNRGSMDEHIAPFLGILNHDEVINALIDVGYKGCFTLECDSSLRKYKQWTGFRRQWDKDTRLSEPQLFMQRHIEKMMFETAEWILNSYGLGE